MCLCFYETKSNCVIALAFERKSITKALRSCYFLHRILCCSLTNKSSLSRNGKVCLRGSKKAARLANLRMSSSSEQSQKKKTQHLVRLKVGMWSRKFEFVTKACKMLDEFVEKEEPTTCVGFESNAHSLVEKQRIMLTHESNKWSEKEKKAKSKSITRLGFLHEFALVWFLDANNKTFSLNKQTKQQQQTELKCQQLTTTKTRSCQKSNDKRSTAFPLCFFYFHHTTKPILCASSNNKLHTHLLWQFVRRRLFRFLSFISFRQLFTVGKIR